MNEPDVFKANPEVRGFLERVSDKLGGGVMYGKVTCTRVELRELRGEFISHEVLYQRQVDSKEWHEYERKWEQHFKSRGEGMKYVAKRENDQRNVNWVYGGEDPEKTAELAILTSRIFEQIDRQRIMGMDRGVER
jgi:hypothetical protein